MNTLLKDLIEMILPPKRVEFDYHDDTGLHRGSCYIRCTLAPANRVIDAMHQLGYTNVRLQ
ncbi:MAG: hypothetical protein ACPGU7_04720 [Gammaproteobacteria bacterium]